jgi:hypothetical protein
VRAIASLPATLQWPLEIFGRDHQEFLERYRRISRAFTLTTRRQRPGYLQVQRPDGSARQIRCFYSDGLGGETGQNHLFARPVVSLFCPEGKWSDTEAITIARSFADSGGGGGTASFYTPYMYLSSSSMVGSGDLSGGGLDPASLTLVNNPGDVEGWPEWTITGPMTELRTWNVTRGSRFALTYTLTAGQSITITTDLPSVRGPAGINLSKYIDWFSTAGTELWPLSDGDNVIGLEVDGATSATSVQMTFVPRYDNS